VKLKVDGVEVDVDAQLLDIDRVECEDSLYEFMRRGWKYIDPAPWVDMWAVEAVAEHLQAVVDGEINRLIINIPPRMGKSSITSVALPAWTWAQPLNSPTSGPGVPFLFASYKDALSMRDSVKCRRLIKSPWYQERWGSRFQLMADQDTKHRFANTSGGERLITSIGAGVTGEGGNIIVIDDPNAANDVESEATTEDTIEWWEGTMPTRLNDAKRGAYVIIQQRLAENDLTGHILEKNDGRWTHLCLPMRFEKDRSFVTTIGWEDPREDDGELLAPERFDEETLRNLEKELGPYKAAGQLQQRPEPKGGGIIQRDYWQLWEEEAFPLFDYILAFVDTAYTEKEQNDPSAMTVWGVFSQETKSVTSRVIDRLGNPEIAERTYIEGAPKVMLMHAWTERLEINPLVQKIEKTCRVLKVDKLLIENKASGISVSQELRRIYQDVPFTVQLCDPKSQDKYARLYSVQNVFAEGIVYAPDRSWADKVITQCALFPKAKHDDLVDTVSGALRHLREIGMITRKEERSAEIAREKTKFGKGPTALYPS
jgi:predicted phage terminase large subunit-like protein